MVRRVEAPITLVLLGNIQWFGTYSGYIHQYMCGVACLIPFIVYSSSPIICQFYFAFALVALRFLFRILFLSVFLFCILTFLFLFQFTLEPATAGSAGREASRSVARSRDTIEDPSFPVSDFIEAHGAYLVSRQFAAIKGYTAAERYIHLCGSGDAVVGTRKKSWWHYGGHGASICRYVSHAVDILLVCWFEKIDYKNALGQIVVDASELAMFKILPAIEILASLFRFRYVDEWSNLDILGLLYIVVFW